MYKTYYTTFRFGYLCLLFVISYMQSSSILRPTTPTKVKLWGTSSVWIKGCCLFCEKVIDKIKYEAAQKRKPNYKCDTISMVSTASVLWFEKMWYKSQWKMKKEFSPSSSESKMHTHKKYCLFLYFYRLQLSISRIPVMGFSCSVDVNSMVTAQWGTIRRYIVAQYVVSALALLDCLVTL